MASMATLEATSPAQTLERLSIGELIRDVRIVGLLDLDPLVVSRWLCGEDMRGIYQPILLRHCILDGLDMEKRTFYELVELVGCHIAAAHFAHAYFYSSVMIEDCVFEGKFDGRGIQNDGRMVIHNTVFVGWAEFAGISLRGRVNLVDLSFPSGTNLLHVLVNDSPERLGREIMFSNCQFRPADVPAGLEAAQLGITPFIEGDPGGAEG